MSNQATEVILMKAIFKLNEDILICLSGNMEWLGIDIRPGKSGWKGPESQEITTW
jgi:hypothetical protein